MSPPTSESNREIWIVLGLVVFSYFIFSRVVNDPLKVFPGPKLAAWTRLYIAYYETIKGGRLVEQIERLHEQYGPIVRIGPNQLHFIDHHAYTDIYNNSPNLTKEPAFYGQIGDHPSLFTFIDQRKHKFRHDVISPFFSRRAIIKLENVVQDKINLLIEKMQLYKGGNSFDMSLALRSATLDIITSYCFATSYSALTVPDFQHPLLLSLKAATSAPALTQNFPLLGATLKALPDWALVLLNPSMQGFVDFHKRQGVEVDRLIANPESLQYAEHETIFHHLMGPDVLKKGGRALDRQDLVDEAVILVTAGSDTVGNACTIGMFHVLDNEDVHVRLKKELEEVWPDVEAGLGYETLKKLPYLTAVIKESLRMSHGVVSRLPRVVGSTPLQVMGQEIPPRTVVSMTSVFMHWNEGVFQDSRRFNPSRWLQPDTREMDSSLVPFSKGLRSCIGMNLAWCELYLLFANVFRKLDLEIDGTTVDDLVFRGFFLPEYRGRPFHARVCGNVGV